MFTKFEGIWHTVIIFIMYINTIDISDVGVNVIFNSKIEQINAESLLFSFLFIFVCLLTETLCLIEIDEICVLATFDRSVSRDLWLVPDHYHQF